MPLFKTIHPNSETKIFIWKIQESFEELFGTVVLNERSLARLNNMKSELHQRGFLSVRRLLMEAGYTDFDMFYTEDGKPHLKDGQEISISHSYHFSAVIVSSTPVGIDIEKNREKIERISSKFIGKESQFLTKENIVLQLTVIWGAKESLFKIHPDGGLLFKHHLPIEPFKLEDKRTKGWIKKDNYYEKYDIFFEQIENFSLVYAMN